MMRIQAVVLISNDQRRLEFRITFERKIGEECDILGAFASLSKCTKDQESSIASPSSTRPYALNADS